MPAPTVLRFYSLKREKFFDFLAQNPSSEIQISPKSPLTEAQNVPLSGFEKLKMSHFQVLRSSKCPTYRIWEAQKVPLLAFERPDLPKISLSDYILKPKMVHFQDLRSSKCPTYRWTDPKSATFGFWETRFTPNKPWLNFRWTDPEPRLGSNHRSKLGQVASGEETHQAWTPLADYTSPLVLVCK